MPPGTSRAAAAYYGGLCRSSYICLFMRSLPALLFAAVMVVAACRKEDSITTDSSVRLAFSEDTILFDTVFASIGSTTEFLIVYNNESSTVRLSSVRLGRGAASPFRINVDGVPGPVVRDVEIGPRHSLWIFIEVTIDPTSQSTPFLVTDSVVFEINGNVQDVDLVAFGQNAHFFIPDKSFYGLPYSVIGTPGQPCGTVIQWDSILPYVIYGYAVVDSCTELQIAEGTRVYFFQGGGLWVYRYGSIKVNGTVEHPVTFQGTRLEPGYADVPGQWDRIWINEGAAGVRNEFNNAVIRNAFIGIQAENFLAPYGANPCTLRVVNTIIRNASGIGLLARDYNIQAYNMVIGNCGGQSAALTEGGSYEFNQCTFANYYPGQRSAPAVYINNFYNALGGSMGNDLKKADFRNCIVTGNTDNELELEFVSGAAAEHHFYKTAIKADANTPVTDPAHFTGVYPNLDPAFTDPFNNVFELDSSSAAIDKGDPGYIVPGFTDKDFKGKDRVNDPDLGAFENN